MEWGGSIKTTLHEELGDTFAPLDKTLQVGKSMFDCKMEAILPLRCGFPQHFVQVL